MKYKVWDKTTKTFVQNIVVTNEGKIKLLQNRCCYHLDDDQAKNFLICECSDYKDKYGNYLYKGDIIEGPYGNNCEVVYDGRKWFLYDRIGEICCYEIVNNHKIKIIGNIFETPNLLEVEDE